MPYGPWDEYFVHQLPSPMDVVHDSDRSWSDRCYFNVHSPDNRIFAVTGYGNFPNEQRAHGYAKVASADGRHWDLDAYRPCIDDRGDLYAGPMRWTCVEPLKRWRLEVEPNASGISWCLDYVPKAPLWDLQPLRIRKHGRSLADMHHIKQPGRYSGWIEVDGERFDVDGWTGGRDRTFGVRVGQEIDFWLWFEAVFEDRAIEGWVFESASGEMLYADGGITYDAGHQSARFVKIEHDVQFDGEARHPKSVQLRFTDEDGKTLVVDATASEPLSNVYYSVQLPNRVTTEQGMIHSRWNARDPLELAEASRTTITLDQLMTYDYDGMQGSGVLELYVMGDGYLRYPNWRPPTLDRR